MIQRTAKTMDANARLLLKEALLNPSLQQLFVLEKVQAERAYIEAFRPEEETDAQFLRKLAVLKQEITFVDNFLSFIKEEQSSANN